VKPAFLKGIKLGASGLREALNRDLDQVEALIQSSLRSDVAFIQDLNEIVLAPRGKRLRPALVLLAADPDGEPSRSILLAGAVVEMIHTATLLHDDVVDGSLRRRGRATLNAENGDGAAILMGDYVYSRAITLLVEAELTQVLGLLARTVHRMSIGELLQLELRDRRVLSEEAYGRVIYEKTARLIESCCVSGAILGDRGQDEIEACGEFGRNVGLAFQIVDDVFDYVSDPGTLGKPVGNDLGEGKQTLPLLKAHAAADGAERTHLEGLLAKLAAGEERAPEIIELVRDLGGTAAAMEEARNYGRQARSALERLSRGPARDALAATVDYVLDREL
jgi:octaprenyl-diphosphate synthase